MATSLLCDEHYEGLRAETPPRYQRPRLPTTSGVSGLGERYNYGTIIHNRVFIGGLHISVTEEDLRAKFREYGEISDVKIIRKPEQEKGYAFITFEAPEVAKKVLEESGQRVKINGMDSKVGPAIRKPSMDQTSPGGFKKPDIVLQPLLTPKRNRLTSCPDGGDLSLSFDPSSPAPIPMPMSGIQAPNSTPDNQFLANQLNAALLNPEYQHKLMMAARLAQASSIANVSPLLLQAFMNQQQQQQSSPLIYGNPPPPAPSNNDQVFFPSSPTVMPSPTGANQLQMGGLQPQHLASASPNMLQQVSQNAHSIFFGQQFDAAQQLQNQMTLNAASQLLAAAGGANFSSGLAENQLAQSQQRQTAEQFAAGQQTSSARYQDTIGQVGMVSAGTSGSGQSGLSYSGVAQSNGGAGMGYAQPPQLGGSGEGGSRSATAATVGPPGFMGGSLGGQFQFTIETSSSPEYDA